MRSLRHRTSAVLLALVLGASTGLAACGNDDGADVREIGDEGGSGSGSASGSASGPASGSASGVEEGSASGSASGTGEQACSPVGEDLEGDAAETVEALFRAVTDEDERAILELSLQGATATEISERLGRAERSVRRIRERVRKRLERMQFEE